MTPTTHFQKDLADLLNRHCAENESNTPDFILAEYMLSCLLAFNAASKKREQWYGRSLSINATAVVEDKQ